MSETKRVTYVSVVKSAWAEGKTKDEISTILSEQFPNLDVKKSNSKLNATIKYLSTPKAPRKKKVLKTDEAV